MNFYKIVKYLFCWLNVIMSDKGFADNKTSIETPNDIGVAEKPLSNQTISGRVDINVLKSKLQESESKELKKNISILVVLILGLGVMGIYLSL
ncbi:hypothetical protein IDH21_04440 [Pelagibacterales bacterium SAG-MED47]|nr:hypothetical protein [Pelagibacterales bacterium SAG-MED47]